VTNKHRLPLDHRQDRGEQAERAEHVGRPGQ
jgi:hypothetical protein